MLEKKLKGHNTNNLIYAGAVVVAEGLGVRDTVRKEQNQRSPSGNEDWHYKPKAWNVIQAYR